MDDGEKRGASEAKIDRIGKRRSPKGAARVAGVILAGRQFSERLGLKDAATDQVAVVLGVSRSRAFEQARAIRDDAQRAPGPGRPKKEPVPAPDGWKQWACVCAAVRTFLMQHPGAAYRTREKIRASDVFKDFVLSLMAPEGLARGMTLAQVATAVDVTKNTLASWVEDGRKKAGGGLPRRRVARLCSIGPEEGALDIRPVTPQEFEEATNGSSRFRRHNESLLHRAEKEPVKIVFESKDGAISRINALYILRRKMNTQVKMVRRGSVLMLGPGEYLPPIRKDQKTE